MGDKGQRLWLLAKFNFQHKMAEISLDPNFEALADHLRDILRRENVLLTDYADGIFRLSVEAWMNESGYLIFRPGIDVYQRRLLLEGPQGSAELIARELLREPHIVNARESAQAVKFYDLMAALVAVGRKFFDKGF